MAVESPAAFNQGGSYSAEVTRRAVQFMTLRGATIGSVTGGIVASGDCKIKAAAAELKSEVAPGELIIPGSSSSTQSGYYARVSSETVLAHAASDPTNPRIDRVSAIIKDKAYAGAEDTFSLALETGTPKAGATLANLEGAAAAPTSSYTLGYVLVPAKATTLEAVDILNTATRLVLLNGRIYGRSVIATEQTRSNAAFGTLPTPDEVKITVPERCLLSISALIEAKTSASTTNIGLFVNGEELGGNGFVSGTSFTQFFTTGGYNAWYPLATGLLPTGVGMNYWPANGAAGTYTVTLQFNTEGGATGTVKNRQLYVEARQF